MPLQWRNSKVRRTASLTNGVWRNRRCPQKTGSKALCRSAGEGAGVAASADQCKLTWTPVMCCMEKPGSSNWSVAEQLFSPRLRRGLDAFVQTSLVLWSLPHGCPGCLCCPAGPSVPAARGPGPCSSAKAPGGPLAAGRQGGAAAPVELRMLRVQLSGVCCPLRGAEPPQLPTVPSLLPPGSRRGPAGRERGCHPGTCPGTPPSLRPGGARAPAESRARHPPLPPRRRSPEPGRTPGEGTVPCALPPPSPRACLLPWSLALMN